MKKRISHFIKNPDDNVRNALSSVIKTKKYAPSIYAESVYSDIEQHIVEKYGKKTDVCFCRLFKKRCGPKCNYIARKPETEWMDHGRMYYDGKKYTYIGEPYGITNEQLENLLHIANKHNLSIEISASYASWFPSQTIAVIIQNKGER